MVVDVDVTLERIRELVNEQLDGGYIADRAQELCELLEAIDEWIAGGGVLPARWQRPAEGSAASC